MEKIALIGDTHFDRKAENPIIKKYIREGQRKFFGELAKDLKSRDIKTIFMTGDIHHNRNYVDIEALVYTKRLLQEKLADFNVYIIMGNHDMYYENSYDITALELFEDIPNVTVCRTNVEKVNVLGRKWFLFPWITADKEEKTIEFLKKHKNKEDILFGHFEILGVNMEGKSKSTFGMDSNMFLDSSRLTISGHYHGKSRKTSSDSELIYLGSPYPMTFANADEDHGYWILDEDLDMEFVKNEISPSFVDIWDSEIEKLDDLDISNSFVRLYMSNNKTAEEFFELCVKVESKNPLMIKKIPYSGDEGEIKDKTEVEREANSLLAMDTFKLSEVYVDQYSESLPKLKLEPDSKKAVLTKIKGYKTELNL